MSHNRAVPCTRVNSASWRFRESCTWCGCKEAHERDSNPSSLLNVYRFRAETRRFHDGTLCFPPSYFSLTPRSTESPRNGMRFRSSRSDIAFWLWCVVARKLRNNIIRPCTGVMRATTRVKFFSWGRQPSVYGSARLSPKLRYTIICHIQLKEIKNLKL